MTDAVQGRSLWQDAWRRLRGNRLAMAGLIYLVLITLAAIVVPAISGHEFTAQYPSYIRQRPSLEAFPKPEAYADEIAEVARRAKVNLKDWKIEGGRVHITVSSDKPVDERVTRYLDRSNSFKDSQVEAKSADGLELTMSARAEQKHFYFGTDGLGRDLLTRTFIAGRISLLVGLLAGTVAVVIGTLWGAVSGFMGGRVDEFMMRLVDIIYALPFTLFVIMLVVFFGHQFVLVFVAIGAVLWLDMARIVRGQTLSLKRQEYVQAAEALGVSAPGILLRHIIPNMLGPIVIYLTLLVPQVIILESFLSYLGLGIQEPMTSWGVQIAEGAANMEVAPYLLFIPTFFLSTTLFALNFLGDGLRDALDPKDR